MNDIVTSTCHSYYGFFFSFMNGSHQPNWKIFIDGSIEFNMENAMDYARNYMGVWRSVSLLVPVLSQNRSCWADWSECDCLPDPRLLSGREKTTAHTIGFSNYPPTRNRRACSFSFALCFFVAIFFKRRIKIVMFYICTCIHGVISSKSMERRKSDSIFCLAKSQSFEYIRLTKALLYHLSFSPLHHTKCSVTELWRSHRPSRQ